MRARVSAEVIVSTRNLRMAPATTSTLPRSGPVCRSHVAWLHACARRASLAMAAALAMSTGAGAAGFGVAPGSTQLGQPLDLRVPIRLDPGEGLEARCVSADVTIGERSLAPAAVRVAIEPTGVESARIRVVTLLPVDEPVVQVQIAAGCSARITRRFVIFADPPAPAVVSAPAFAAAPPEAVAAGAGTAESPSSAPATPARPPEPERASPALPAPRVAATPPDPERAAELARQRAERRAARRAEREARAALARERAAAQLRDRAEAPGGPGQPVAAAAAAARLQLELAPRIASPEAQAVEEALAAVAEAASAARAAASAASASQARISALEREAAALREELRAGRSLNEQLRQQLASRSAGLWTWPLLGLALLLGALALWLAWRLAAAQREVQASWKRAAAAADAPPAPAFTTQLPTEATPSRQPTAPIPFVNSVVKVGDTLAQPITQPSRAWPAPAAAASVPSTVALPRPPLAVEPEQASYEAIARTEPMPPGSRPGESMPRDVSIEELLDLEQQAEFFIVLGQDEAAIELLAEHLRNTGGGSPLPYLKLLEIYHRRGDRDDYERTRTRFNHRFNAYAPEWGSDLTAGRSLEDYPSIQQRLIQVWPRPLDAMAELEALMFRKSRGELFDLPAYREVLFLYALARDLLDREAAATQSVDLLLPLADGTEFSATAPAPFITLAPSTDGAAGAEASAPLQTLDFDLSRGDADRPSSIFDTLDEVPTTQPRPRPRT